LLRGGDRTAFDRRRCAEGAGMPRPESQFLEQPPYAGGGPSTGAWPDAPVNPRRAKDPPAGSLEPGTRGTRPLGSAAGVFFHRRTYGDGRWPTLRICSPPLDPRHFSAARAAGQRAPIRGDAKSCVLTAMGASDGWTAKPDGVVLSLVAPAKHGVVCGSGWPLFGGKTGGDGLVFTETQQSEPS
jgi:hypothetical protein